MIQINYKKKKVERKRGGGAVGMSNGLDGGWPNSSQNTAIGTIQ